MPLHDTRGIKAPQWAANELAKADDLNFIHESTYKNLCDLVHNLCGAPNGKAVIINGFDVLFTSGRNVTVGGGMAISFEGRYFTGSTWGFVADGSGASAYLVVAPWDTTTLTVDAGDGSDRYDSIEIRPVQTAYDSKSRDFKDPVTSVISSSSVNTKIEYGAEARIVKGTAGAGVAPARTAGWIKIAEIYVPAGMSTMVQANILPVTAVANITTSFNPWTADRQVTFTKGGISKSHDLIAGHLIDYVTNGDFSVWQRGASFSSPANGALLADKWTLSFNGTGGTRTFSKHENSQSSRALSDQCMYGLRNQTTVAGSGQTYNTIYQKLTDLRRFQGKTLVLSFYVWADAVYSLIASWSFLYGTGGSPSATDFPASVSFRTLANTWRKVTVEIPVADFSGKTWGTDGYHTSHLGIFLWYPNNATCDIIFAGVSVTERAGPIVYVPKEPSVNEIECLRYYERIGNGSTSYPMFEGYAAGAGVTFYFSVPFKQPKLVTPTLSGVNGTWNNINCGTPTIAYIDRYGVTLQVTSAAAGRVRTSPDSTDDYIYAESNY